MFEIKAEIFNYWITIYTGIFLSIVITIIVSAILFFIKNFNTVHTHIRTFYWNMEVLRDVRSISLGLWVLTLSTNSHFLIALKNLLSAIIVITTIIIVAPKLKAYSISFYAVVVKPVKIPMVRVTNVGTDLDVKLRIYPPEKEGTSCNSILETFQNTDTQNIAVEFMIGFLFLTTLIGLVWWVVRKYILTSVFIRKVFDVSMIGIIIVTITTELLTGNIFLAFLWENVETLVDIDMKGLYSLINSLKNISTMSEDFKLFDFAIKSLYAHIKATENIMIYLIEINSKEASIDYKIFDELLQQFHVTGSIVILHLNLIQTSFNIPTSCLPELIQLKENFIKNFYVMETLYFHENLIHYITNHPDPKWLGYIHKI